MCNLCGKLTALDGIESAAVRPIRDTLDTLHKAVELCLEDHYLFWLQQETKVRKLLGAIYSKALNPTLKEIMENIDDELEDLKRYLVDYPPQRDTGRLKSLQAVRSPSESASVQLLKRSRLESETIQKPKQQIANKRKTGLEDFERGYETGSRGSTGDEKPLPDLPGSDIDPSEENMLQSVRIVEDWYRRCDEAIAAYGQDDDSDCGTIVPISGGKIAVRTKLDVGIWRIPQRSRRDRSSSNIPQVPRTGQRFLIGHDPSVYDRPSNKVDLEVRIVKMIVRAFASKETAQRFHNSCVSRDREKRAKKLSKKRNIPLHEAARLLQPRRRREGKLMMSGGRSPGESPRTSLETFASNSSRLGVLESQESYADIPEDDDYDSGSSDTSVLSSRSSATNFGSLVNQQGLPKDPPAIDGITKSFRAPLSIQTLASTIHQQSRPSTLIAIGQSPSPVVRGSGRVATKECCSLRREVRRLKSVDRQTLGGEGPRGAAMIPRHLQSEDRSHEQRSKELLDENKGGPPKDCNAQVSDSVKNSRRRRAERSSVQPIDRYRYSERERFWTKQK
jgi:hypothetical protein